MNDETTLLNSLQEKYSEMSIDELQRLIDSVKAKIAQHIGVPLTPTVFNQMEKFDGETLIVNVYPIHEIHLLQVNNHELSDDDYLLDCDAGLIYFNEHYKGLLKLEYSACLTMTQINMYVLPLVQDMVDYELDTCWTKNASSIREGDVSINIDTSIGKGALIQKRLDDLKYQFNTYARMI